MAATPVPDYQPPVGLPMSPNTTSAVLTITANVDRPPMEVTATVTR
jgi:hypothetical protein